MDARNVYFIYKPTPKQKEFHKTKAPFKLYGGAAGGGKTDALLGEMIINCLKYPGIKQLFLRKTYSQVEEIIQERLPKMLKKANGERPYHISKGILTFNNSTIILGYWQDDKKNDRYFSTEYDVIAVDELTRTIYKKEDLQKLLIRNRTSNVKLRMAGFTPYFMAATNPGGLGHTYVKETWIDQKPRTGFEKKDFPFVSARLEDNPHLLENDPLYVKKLDGLADENLRKAMRFGDWNVFEGQFFPEYLEMTHSVTEHIPIGGWKRTILCLDYGYRKPASVHLMRRDGDANIFVSSELYVTEHTYADLGKAIKSQYAEFYDTIDYIVADPAIFAKSGGDNSGADIIAKETGLRVIPGNNNRQAGRTLFKTVLKNDTFFIQHGCTDLKREITNAIYDKKKDNDLDTNGSDHALDDVRYGLMDIAGDAVDQYNKDIETMNEKLQKPPQSNNLLSTKF